MDKPEAARFNLKVAYAVMEAVHNIEVALEQAQTSDALVKAEYRAVILHRLDQVRAILQDALIS